MVYWKIIPVCFSFSIDPPSSLNRPRLSTGSGHKKVEASRRVERLAHDEPEKEKPLKELITADAESQPAIAPEQNGKFSESDFDDIKA